MGTGISHTVAAQLLLLLHKIGATDEADGGADDRLGALCVSASYRLRSSFRKWSICSDAGYGRSKRRDVATPS